MKIRQDIIAHTFRNKYLKYKGGAVSSSGSSSSGGSIVVEPINVYDGLDSDSTTAALSANQGRILNEKNGIDILPIVQAVFDDFNLAKPTYQIPFNDANFHLIFDNIATKTFYCSALKSNTDRLIIPDIKQIIENSKGSSYTLLFTIKEINFKLTILNSMSSSNYSIEFNKYLPLSGGEMNGDARIYTTDGNLYIGNKDNTGYVYFQSIASQNGADKWIIDTTGNASFINLKTKNPPTVSSDIRLKSNIKPLENRGYIQPIKYTMDGREQIGFSAQEMKKLYPELVVEDENKFLSVAYSQYTAILQAQIIDLNKKIEDLQNQINELK